MQLTIDGDEVPHEEVERQRRIHAAEQRVIDYLRRHSIYQARASALLRSMERKGLIQEVSSGKWMLK
jgi:hypothetical protein